MPSRISNTHFFFRERECDRLTKIFFFKYASNDIIFVVEIWKYMFDIFYWFGYYLLLLFYSVALWILAINQWNETIFVICVYDFDFCVSCVCYLVWLVRAYLIGFCCCCCCGSCRSYIGIKWDILLLLLRVGGIEYDGVI